MAIESLKQSIGCKIRDKRKKAGLTQSAFASLFGKTRFWLTAIETGINLPTLDGLYEIADALHCSVYNLLPLNSGGHVEFTGTGSEDSSVKENILEILEETKNDIQRPA
jgi:transcriptional regulator with XRE-family HTH domain